MFSAIKRFYTYWLIKLTHGMLTCGEADRFMVDYIEYKLDPRVRQRFEDHLANCICCKGFLDAYKRTIELSRAYGEPVKASEAPRMPPEVMAAILTARKDPPRS
ncbi:MAG: hypothetical protein U1F34_05045 [Gammaproteobacteria bacterium]